MDPDPEHCSFQRIYCWKFRTAGFVLTRMRKLWIRIQNIARAIEFIIGSLVRTAGFVFRRMRKLWIRIRNSAPASELIVSSLERLVLFSGGWGSWARLSSRIWRASPCAERPWSQTSSSSAGRNPLDFLYYRSWPKRKSCCCVVERKKMVRTEGNREKWAFVECRGYNCVIPDDYDAVIASTA